MRWHTEARACEKKIALQRSLAASWCTDDPHGALMRLWEGRRRVCARLQKEEIISGTWESLERCQRSPACPHAWRGARVARDYAKPMPAPCIPEAWLVASPLRRWVIPDSLVRQFSEELPLGSEDSEGDVESSQRSDAEGAVDALREDLDVLEELETQDPLQMEVFNSSAAKNIGRFNCEFIRYECLGRGGFGSAWRVLHLVDEQAPVPPPPPDHRRPSTRPVPCLRPSSTPNCRVSRRALTAAVAGPQEYCVKELHLARER